MKRHSNVAFLHFSDDRLNVRAANRFANPMLPLEYKSMKTLSKWKPLNFKQAVKDTEMFLLPALLLLFEKTHKKCSFVE